MTHSISLTARLDTPTLTQSDVITTEQLLAAKIDPARLVRDSGPHFLIVERYTVIGFCADPSGLGEPYVISAHASAAEAATALWAARSVTQGYYPGMTPEALAQQDELTTQDDDYDLDAFDYTLPEPELTPEQIAAYLAEQDPVQNYEEDEDGEVDVDEDGQLIMVYPLRAEQQEN